MLTRCPHCRTSFRVRPEQLRMRGGRVRCGHCSKPFNALEALFEEDGLTPALADAVESPQDTSNAGTDDDGAPLFLLEDADPDAQRAADGDGDDDEIPELFIEGWSWRRSHTPELSPGRAERSPDTERLGIPSGDVGDGDDGAAGPESPRPTETDTAGRSIEGTGETDGSPDGISEASDPGPETDQDQDQDQDFSVEFIYPAAEVDADAMGATLADDRADEPPAAAADLPTRGGPAAGDANAPEADQDRLAPVIVSEDASQPAPLTRPPEIPAVIPRIRNEDDSALLLGDDPADLATTRPAAPIAGYWGIGIGTLLMLLAVQSVLLFRHSAVQWLPASQPFYTSLCARLGCDMPLPTEAALIAIASSDLHPDERRPGLFMLRTTIENRARFDQALPHLELTLTDARDRAIARRVVAPEEWMPSASQGEPFPAGRQIETTIPFMAESLQPIGYRVYAFYP